MEYPLIIGVIGPVRSGKTTVSNYLVKEYGYRLASNSDILREIAAKLGLGQDRQSLSRLGDAIFSSLGNAAIARHRISSELDAPIVVDGIRYREELDVYFAAPSFKLLGLISTDEDRYGRALSIAREGKDKELTWERFLALSQARSESDLKVLLQRADAIIQNVSDRQALEREVDKIMRAWSVTSY